MSPCTYCSSHKLTYPLLWRLLCLSLRQEERDAEAEDRRCSDPVPSPSLPRSPSRPHLPLRLRRRLGRLLLRRREEEVRFLLLLSLHVHALVAVRCFYIAVGCRRMIMGPSEFDIIRVLQYSTYRYLSQPRNSDLKLKLYLSRVSHVLFPCLGSSLPLPPALGAPGLR